MFEKVTGDVPCDCVTDSDTEVLRNSGQILSVVHVKEEQHVRSQNIRCLMATSKGLAFKPYQRFVSVGCTYFVSSVLRGF